MSENYNELIDEYNELMDVYNEIVKILNNDSLDDEDKIYDIGVIVD